MPDQKERAQQFLELHRGPQILILPNVWDAASARVVEAGGFPRWPHRARDWPTRWVTVMESKFHWTIYCGWFAESYAWCRRR